ncbi:MAG: hypothetical protein RKE49_10930 [Oceanicaulis sp.]
MSALLKIIAVCIMTAGLTAGCATPRPPVSASQGPLVMHYVQGMRTPVGVMYLTGTAPIGAAGQRASAIKRETRASLDTGGVRVRIDFAGSISTRRGEALAAGLAHSLEAARSIFPAAPAARVEVRIRIVDRLEERRAGPHLKLGSSPWRLDFDVEAGRLNAESGQAWLNAMVSHELYHLMMIETGWRANTAAPRPSRAVLEEVAASLFGHCANLASARPALIDQTPITTTRAPGSTGPARAPSSGREMRAAAEALRKGAAPQNLHFALSRSLFLRYAGGEGRINPDTTNASALLAACLSVGADPARLPDLMEQLLDT